MLKRIGKILLIVVIILVVIIGGGAFYITRGLSSGAQLAINTVDLSQIDDGAYTGRYDSGRFSNELKVTVKDHKITSIDVVKDLAIHKEEITTTLFKEVIDRQNTDVDVISGGTVSSKAYLKAIENALNK